MSERRNKEATVLLKFPGKNSVKIELFSASKWGQPGTAYRARLNGRWLDPEDGKYWSPYHLFKRLASLATGVDVVIPAKPDMPRGTPVRVPAKHTSEQDMPERTRTTSEPFLGFDGRWRVQVLVWGRGPVFLPVDELELLAQPKMCKNENKEPQPAI